MSTRSIIGIKVKNEIKAVYCHWDGYPTGVGAVLNDHYRDEESIIKMINLGDLSFLGEVPEDDPELWKNIEHSNKCCTYNGRGEDTHYQIFNTLMEYVNAANEMNCEYAYLYDNDKWCFIDIYENKYMNLKDYLKDSENIEYQLLDTLWENNESIEDDTYESINIKDIKKIQIEALVKKISILPYGKTILDNINDSIYNAAKEGKCIASTLILNLTNDIRQLLDSYYKALGFKDTDYGVFLNQYRVFW